MGSVLELVPEVTVTTLYQVPLQLAKPSVNSEPKKKKLSENPNSKSERHALKHLTSRVFCVCVYVCHVDQPDANCSPLHPKCPNLGGLTAEFWLPSKRRLDASVHSQ